MNWTDVGLRIRRQREYLGYTREQFAEMLNVTPKFCSDIELGVKGMSVTTLCNISTHLRLSTDYILFGADNKKDISAVEQLLKSCTSDELVYAEQMLKTLLAAMNHQ